MRGDLEERGDLVEQVEGQPALAGQSHAHPPACFPKIGCEITLPHAARFQALEDLLSQPVKGSVRHESYSG